MPGSLASVVNQLCGELVAATDVEAQAAKFLLDLCDLKIEQWVFFQVTREFSAQVMNELEPAVTTLKAPAHRTDFRGLPVTTVQVGKFGIKRFREFIVHDILPLAGTFRMPTRQYAPADRCAVQT